MARAIRQCKRAILQCNATMAQCKLIILRSNLDCKFIKLPLLYCSVRSRRICFRTEIRLDSVPVGCNRIFCIKNAKQKFLHSSNTPFAQRANKNNRSARLYVSKKPLKKLMLAFFERPLIRKLQMSISLTSSQTQPCFFWRHFWETDIHWAFL